MKFLIVVVAALVAGVTSTPIKAPLDCTTSEGPTKSGDAPETGLVGAVGYDVAGNLVNDLWIMADDMTKSNGFVAPLIGTVAKPVLDVGLTFTDDVVGKTVGDTVSRVGILVKEIGGKLVEVPILGGLLKGLLTPGGQLVEKLGGDKLTQ